MGVQWGNMAFISWTYGAVTHVTVLFVRKKAYDFHPWTVVSKLIKVIEAFTPVGNGFFPYDRFKTAVSRIEIYSAVPSHVLSVAYVTKCALSHETKRMKTLRCFFPYADKTITCERGLNVKFISLKYAK